MRVINIHYCTLGGWRAQAVVEVHAVSMVTNTRTDTQTRRQTERQTHRQTTLRVDIGSNHPHLCTDFLRCGL